MKSTTRVQMELPERSISRLKHLKDKTEAASYAEVTKNAYRLYEMMIGLKDEGSSFMIKDNEGNVKELELFVQ